MVVVVWLDGVQPGLMDWMKWYVAVGFLSGVAGLTCLVKCGLIEGWMADVPSNER